MNHALSFVPAPRRTARLCQKRRLAWIGINLGALLLGSAGTIAARAVILGGETATASAVESAQAKLDSVIAENQSLASELQAIESRLTAHAEATQHPDWSILLGYISNISANSIALETFELDPGASPASYRVALSGVARSQNAVTGFLLGLEKAGVFSKTDLLRSGVSAENTFTFEIACEIGDASIDPEQPEGG